VYRKFATKVEPSAVALFSQRNSHIQRYYDDENRVDSPKLLMRISVTGH